MTSEFSDGAGTLDRTSALPLWAQLEAELRRRLAAGEPPSALAREVAKARSLKRSDVYDAIQRLRGW